MRCRLAAASARNLPAVMCGMNTAGLANITSASLDITAIIAGPAPLYGIGVMSMPVPKRNSSIESVPAEPVPDSAQRSLPGLALA